LPSQGLNPALAKKRLYNIYWGNQSIELYKKNKKIVEHIENFL
jgi:hypothetical protein